MQHMCSSDQDTCKVIANLDDNILGAGIIENLALVSIFSKPNVPLPKEEKFNLMFAQSEIMISIAKSNADFFGGFRYVVSSFENSDTMFFPSKNETTGKDRVIVLQVLRPCDHEKIAREVAPKISSPF